ncbi:MAG: hypothetical protein JSW15_07465 [Deltaproteobacteria bacterium]|nr:MAG: hypothetical protein JSW15_07465 [Deltaproteobacteria bacterium]
MERKGRIHIAAEVDPDLWEKFREQALGENLTTGQLLDKLIVGYLDMVQNRQQEDITSSPARTPEDMLLEQGSIVEEDQKEKS